jgi:signal transduction histidine kinase
MSSNGDDPRTNQNSPGSNGPRDGSRNDSGGTPVGGDSALRPVRALVPTAFSPSPEATYVTVERLARLIAKVGGLLDESLLSLTNASTCLTKHAGAIGQCVTAEMHGQLTDAAKKLEQVSELVHGAMQSSSVSLGSPLLSKSRPISVRDAVEHARDVLRPFFERNDIEVNLQIAEGVANTPAGALYTVILNAMQNAAESIERRRGGGCIVVNVRSDVPPTKGGYGRDSRDWQTLEVIDDGEGPPSTRDSARVFDLGFTTKPRGTGVGLAVAKSVIQSMGGTIELVANVEKAPMGKRGAVMRARYPSPDAMLHLRFGGAA